MQTIPMKSVKPMFGEFQILTFLKEGIPRHAYWVRLHKGVIQDCSPELRENYYDVHIKYLLGFLGKTQGEPTVKQIVR